MADPLGGLNENDRTTLRFFQLEVALQCRFALMAYQDLQDALRQCPVPCMGVRTEEVARAWYSLQAFLIAAANVSKLLWPIRSRNPDVQRQRQALRTSLSVDDQSPLFSRDLRNYFEHFDEHLEDWIARSEYLGIIELFLGPPHWPKKNGRSDLVRVLDPDAEIVITPSVRYELKPVRVELEAIHDRVHAKLGRFALVP